MQIEFYHELDSIVRKHFRDWSDTVETKKGPNTLFVTTVLPPVSIRVQEDGRCFTSWSRVSEDFCKYLYEQKVPFEITMK